jgi:hypothetical protein
VTRSGSPASTPRRSGASSSKVTVTDHKARDHDGVLVDAFLLESEVHGQKSKAWVTQSGELLEQEFGPPLEDYSLRATKRESVHLPGKK